MAAKLLVLIEPLVEVLRKTETLPALEFVTAISNFPSPSKSPIATENGFKPVVKSTLAAKLPLVILPLVEVLRKTEIEFELTLATTISCLPS